MAKLLTSIPKYENKKLQTQKVKIPSQAIKINSIPNDAEHVADELIDQINKAKPTKNTSNTISDKNNHNFRYDHWTKLKFDQEIQEHGSIGVS
jgi:hypothetical protein